MRILLVEDDDRIADALKEALTDQHYSVDIAADGEAFNRKCACVFQ